MDRLLAGAIAFRPKLDSPDPSRVALHDDRDHCRYRHRARSHVEPADDPEELPKPIVAVVADDEAVIRLMRDRRRDSIGEEVGAASEAARAPADGALPLARSDHRA